MPILITCGIKAGQAFKVKNACKNIPAAASDNKITLVDESSCSDQDVQVNSEARHEHCKSKNDTGRYKSRPHSKTEKSLQKKARRQRRKQLLTERKTQALVTQLETERDKLLQDQARQYEKKITIENTHMLHLERLLDKCRKGTCATTSKVGHARKEGKLPELDNAQEKKILNSVRVEELEFTIKETHRVVLGEGCFGKCFLAKLKRSGIFVTVKFGKKKAGRYSESLRNEAEILSRLCHPNVPFLFGIIEGCSPGLIIEFHGDTDKLSSLTLSQVCRDKNLEMSCSVWLDIMFCCCSTFAYIHEAGILYNDIKTNNVLITLKEGHWIPTIIDFGKASYLRLKEKYASLSESQIQKYKDNYPHIAPELYILGSERSVRSDIYSFGWMLRTLEHCFLGKNIKEVFQICLHSCPSKRPPSMLAIRDMLSKYNV